MSEPQEGSQALTDSEKDERKPTSKLDEAALFLRLKRWVIQDARAQKNWRMEARKDFAFEAGDQWSEQDRAYLRDQLRPIITFNRTKATISAVTGMEVNNRQEVRFIPRTEEDAGITELYTEAARWVRDQCDAEDEESDMFGDDCICGVGFTDTRVEYDTDPDGMIAVDRLDPLQMVWDASSTKKNLADARRIAHCPKVDIARARDMFPDYTDDELNAGWLAQDWEANEDDAIDREKARHYWPNNNEPKDYKEVTIIRIQWYEEEPYHRVANPVSGKIEELDPDKFKAIAKVMKARNMPIVAVRQKRRHYYQAFLGNDCVLDWGDAPSQEDFTFQAVTGYRDQNKRQFYGLVRLMRDPQQWANKFFSTIQHVISTSGKGILAEATAFDDVRKAEANWAKPDAITIVADGAISGEKIIPKPGGQLPPGIPQMLEFVVSTIRDVTGINLEVLGLADRDQAASLEAQRRQAAVTILATFFDGLRRYRKKQGRLLLDMIRHYISDGRLIRVVGEQGAKYIPLVRSEDVVKYDVIVDEAATSPNQKEATWAIVTQLMPTLTELGLPLAVWEQILKVSPLPASVVEKIIAALQEQAKQPPAPDPKMLLAQEQTKQLQLKTQAEQQKAQLDAVKGQMDIQNEQQRNQMEAQKMQQEAEQDRQKFALEVAKMVLDLQMQREQANIQRETAITEAQNQQRMGDLKVSQAQEMGAIKAQHAKTAAKRKPEARK